MRRYTLRRRRPRPRRRTRRRRPIRRRRIYIRRPTNNASIVQKFCKWEPISFQNTSNQNKWYIGSYTTNLKEWVTQPNWDLYKILKMKISFLPFTPTQKMPYWPIGNTIIDLDGPWPQPYTANSNLFCNTATSRSWYGNKKHSRYFTPRAVVNLTTTATAGEGTALLPRSTWWNCNNDSIIWGGLRFAHYIENGSNMAIRYHLQKSVWIKWKYLL